MSGSATFTIVTSSSNMKVPRQTVTNVNHLLPCGGFPCGANGSMPAEIPEEVGWSLASSAARSVTEMDPDDGSWRASVIHLHTVPVDPPGQTTPSPSTTPVAAMNVAARITLPARACERAWAVRGNAIENAIQAAARN
jgi:hypothetical protein